MSLAAVTASNAAPTWTQEPALETTGRGAGSIERAEVAG